MGLCSNNSMTWCYADYSVRDTYVSRLQSDWGIPKHKLDKLSVRQLKSLYGRLKNGYKAKTKTKSLVRTYSRSADVVQIYR